MTVTGNKFGYNTQPQTSATTATVAAGTPLALTPTPTFTGTPKVATLFTPSIGLWEDGVALTFQWSANGVPVAGGAGTGATITPTVAQVGQPLTLAVTGTKPGLPPVTRTSAASAPIDPGTQVLQPTPTITGTPGQHPRSRARGHRRPPGWHAVDGPVAGRRRTYTFR